MSELFEFAIARGSSNPLFAVTLRDSAGDPIDLTGAAEVWLEVSEVVETAQADLAIRVQCSFVTDRTTGQVYRRLLDADTTDVTEKTYLAQVRVIIDGTQSWLYPTQPFKFTVFSPVKA